MVGLFDLSIFAASDNFQKRNYCVKMDKIRYINYAVFSWKR
jgi:hypothetical protein